MKRPVDNNADAWALFLSEWLRVENGRVEGIPYCAVQIAEALDVYWCEYLAERTARMEANSREYVAQSRIAALEEALTKIDNTPVSYSAETLRKIARAALAKGKMT